MSIEYLLNAVDGMEIYVDGADEITEHSHICLKKVAAVR
jgi:ribose 5-phosphate isomerase